MNTKLRARLLLAVLLVVAAIIFCAGITWGLPSRDIDKYLFGDELVWSGEKIQQLAGDWTYDPTRGADVDIDPITDRNQVICINETDEQRAEIIRRYRLYSYQPDEMITFRSLASMKPGEGDLDPKLYQYGGLWIYPVGVLLKIASWCGAITLKADPVYYLDHPEEFGRFYIFARLYVVAWALIGVWAVFAITRRITDHSLSAATCAALCYMAMPVVINMAHEAKPHLPAAVLMLLTILSAMCYVNTGKRGWWIATGCLCGAAFGMVLSALPIFIILPVMVLLRKQSWANRIAITIISIVIGGAVYAITNPYLAINALVNREVLQSNLSNSLAMYEIARLGEGFLNAARLITEGASLVIAIVGVLGVIGLTIRKLKYGEREDKVSKPALGWLLAVPALLILVQFIALAAGKPGEYGRFAIMPDIALVIAAIVAIYAFIEHPYRQQIILLAVVLFTALPGSSYLWGFIRDASANDSRMQAAKQIEIFKNTDATTIGILAEPAPYLLPPINLSHWRVLLFPDNTINEQQELPDILIHTRGTPDFRMGVQPSPYYVWPSYIRVFDSTAISWANKRFGFWLRKDLQNSTSQEASINAP